MARFTLRPLLVAEDDANDMFLFTRLLKSAGAIHALHIALDGEEIIRLLTPLVERNGLTALPMLAFLDVRLPGSSGIDVLAWIRTQPELDGMAITLMSAAPKKDEIRCAAELGAQCFLTKFPSVLAISRVLESARTFTGRSKSVRFDLPDNLLY